jgi:hypothetical protein
MWGALAAVRAFSPALQVLERPELMLDLPQFPHVRTLPTVAERGNGRKDCERRYNSEPEGTMSSKGKVATMRVKDVNIFELTPGLANALAASLDASYREYFTADCSGTSTEEAERRIAAIPEEKRYLTRVLDSLDSAFADFDTETAMLDLPHMQNRKPESIKHFLEFRLRQFKMLLDAVEDCVGEKYPATGGNS